MFRKVLFFVLIPAFFLYAPGPASACESCSCSLSRAGADPMYLSDKTFFDFTQEGVNWNTQSAQDAHRQHHEGHHVHNKTHEEFYHFSLGTNVTEDVTLLAELPYIVRSSTEVDSHATLGKHETSQGLGDGKLSAIWRFWREHGNFLGALIGVKLPTGSTGELTSQGILFEPELQPGSGSADGTAGAVFQWDPGPFMVHGNVAYTFRTEGAQDFEHGDLFSSYVSFERCLNPGSKDGRVTLGADMNLQIEQKQTHDGFEIADSGGTTVLLGPSLKIQANDHVAVLANFLLPVDQELGGVHQELDFVWNASIKISW